MWGKCQPLAYINLCSSHYDYYDGMSTLLILTLVSILCCIGISVDCHKSCGEFSRVIA